LSHALLRAPPNLHTIAVAQVAPPLRDRLAMHGDFAEVRPTTQDHPFHHPFHHALLSMESPSIELQPCMSEASPRLENARARPALLMILIRSAGGFAERPSANDDMPQHQTRAHPQ
jgi:hypothetical protein